MKQTHQKITLTCHHNNKKTHAYSDPNFLSNLYMTALNLRNTIRQVKSSLLWPPRAETLNLQDAEKTVPYILWIVGASEIVDTSTSVHRNLLSISQDIIFLASNGCTLMPKHLSLGMAVCHLSGSVQLIGLLNGCFYLGDFKS